MKHKGRLLKLLVQLFKRNVHALLSGNTIRLEDVVDVLTLKDNRGKGDGFEEAIVLLTHASDDVSVAFS